MRRRKKKIFEKEVEKRETLRVLKRGKIKRRRVEKQRGETTGER